MSSNRSIMVVLDQEGIPMTKEQLLRATQKTRSDRNGATTVGKAPSRDLAVFERAPWSSLELNGEQEDTRATTQTVPAEEIRRGVPTRRILSVLGILLLSPFKALRQLYWLIDRDAKIRSQGLQTVGSVIKTRSDSRVVRDPEYGTERTVYTHYVTYRFDANDGTHSGEKKVRNLSNLMGGSPLRVYYLPDTFAPFESAIDREPRAVA